MLVTYQIRVAILLLHADFFVAAQMLIVLTQ